MSDNNPQWNPRESKCPMQRDDFDEMRNKCPVAKSDSSKWWVFKHSDIEEILEDPETFSSDVSSHLSVPNTMDPPEHTAYRELIDHYFSEEVLSSFPDDFRAISEKLVNSAVANDCTEAMGDLGLPYAARTQCAFLGWPTDLAETLVTWTLENQQAARDQDRDRLAKLAGEFESLVQSVIEQQRNSGQKPPTLTQSLIREKIDGHRLSLEELTSIFRNWTVGEVGSLAASIGIILYYLAECPHIVDHLRQADSAEMEDVLDEILRMHGPLVANRRKATRETTIRGTTIEPGDTIYINWVSANRDEEVFGDPDTFDPDGNAENNLLYGKGIHVCPGAPLARMELRIFFKELLEQVTAIELPSKQDIEYAKYPASGFARLLVCLQ
ncbi:cytochrome P450 [Aliifodinibius sp. S!AR15-10]|uniref:cytochrome P450 n=1 Tax=Aliifodinibius sp. S!AR15-10 TaxID=2950437 RepID=UPI0028566E86|nr:cytochrome P450 [Aliifodinibius sp. S!AR15-10]MDR8390730.1 cytochrome P450 [Aliifodinibius sp. S!AR15-10]